MSNFRIGTHEWKPFKRALGHAVMNRRGYKSDLQKYGNEVVSSFEKVGFINTGHTLKHETYSITGLGDLYYKDMFGIFDYAGKRIVGFFKRVIRNISG